MMSLLRFGLLPAALLAACSIGLEQADAGEGQDEECLQLFETCVELAGESPGCTEVFQFCQGSADPTATGAGVMPGSCEQNYIECLTGGSTADECQPLLDACIPSGSTTGCDPLEPTCGVVPDADTSGDGNDGTGCDPDNPGCRTNDCDARHEDCLNTLDSDEACHSIREACLQDDCDAALATCFTYTEAQDTCSELTGCQLDPPRQSSCEELEADCESQGVPASECGNLHPERAECFPEPEGCEWYGGQCFEQYNPSFCDEGRDACEVGILPAVFDCLFIESACEPANLAGSACSQAQQSCEEGFFDIDNCAQTSIAMDPYLWLSELAECNGWV